MNVLGKSNCKILSPIDSRCRKEIEPLREYFSELGVHEVSGACRGGMADKLGENILNSN